MDTDQSKVIVTIGASASTTRVHHRDFPEIRAEGASPKQAASLLVHQLSRALDSALIDWRRERVKEAIADVQAFVDQDQ
jgi:hypothetical protein